MTAKRNKAARIAKTSGSEIFRYQFTHPGTTKRQARIAILQQRLIAKLEGKA